MEAIYERRKDYPKLERGKVRKDGQRLVTVNKNMERENKF
jgi:hypothetical protein